MGRWNTGAQTTRGAKRLELSYLVKNNLIKKGFTTSSRLSWSSENEEHGNIGIECRYRGDGNDYIRLFYTVTANSVKTDYDYKIPLIEKDSNLGKGKVLYMSCNRSGYLCRILYLAYDSPYFKARQAYRNRIYYPIQTCSKLFRYNSRYFELESQILKESQKRYTYTYNGLVTRRAIKNFRLKGLSLKMNELRDQEFILGLRKMGYTGDL